MTSQEKKNSRLDETAPYRFSARTFFPHWEHVYILSPSRVSLMVTSSRDSFTPKRRRRRKKKQRTTFISVLRNSSVYPELSPNPPPPLKNTQLSSPSMGTKWKITKLKNPNWQEANQLAILQASPRIWTRDYRGQIHLAVSAGLELGDFGEKKNLGTLFCCSTPKYKCAANAKNIHWSTLQFTT